ncbi:lytic transglycosylase domain-containing protein [Parasphingorhabdus pacifica]
MKPRMMRRTGPPLRFAGHRRGRWRAWSKVTALAPSLLLPATLAGVSGALLADQPREDPVELPYVQQDPRGLGAGGQLPQDREPGRELLERADEPRELTARAEPETAMPAGDLGIPRPMLAAYTSAADRLAETHPGCGMHWSVLASIGRIESGHARDGRLDVQGTTVSAILGPRLSGGPAIASIPDTDGGALDGDPVWDRAVGAMQFIPETWRKHAADGNDDGVASPHNVHDATLAAGRYLCSGGADLRDPRALAEAVFGYNHSESYVRTVLVWAAAYALGVNPTPAQLAAEIDESDVLAGSRLPNRPEIVALPPAMPPGPPDRPDHPPEGTRPPRPELPEAEGPHPAAHRPAAHRPEQHRPENPHSETFHSGEPQPEAPKPEAPKPEALEPGPLEPGAPKPEEFRPEESGAEGPGAAGPSEEVLSESVSESLSALAQAPNGRPTDEAGTSSESGASDAPDSTGQDSEHQDSQSQQSQQSQLQSEEAQGQEPQRPGTAPARPEALFGGQQSDDVPTGSALPSGQETTGQQPAGEESVGQKPLGEPTSTGEPTPSLPPTGAPTSTEPPDAFQEPLEPCDPDVLNEGAFVTDPSGGELPAPGQTPPSDARPGGVVHVAATEESDFERCRVPEEFDPTGESATSAPFTAGEPVPRPGDTSVHRGNGVGR